jgi:L-2-hydroxyglutarate oxidase LhgO
MTDRANHLIIGGGIMGLTIARELSLRGYGNIVVLEKEKRIGENASGRNSGVLHAGIYYTPDSLKAKFCLNGNRRMKEYCRQRKIPVDETGKVIVTRNAGEVPVLKELYQRALLNGTDAELIDQRELEKVEPYARTCEAALFSPHTAVVDPQKVLEALEHDLVSSGKVRVLKGAAFSGLRNDHEAKVGEEIVKFNLLINAAGSYSDRVAHSFGAGLNYRVLPFRGTYRKLKGERSFLVKGNIYPVPDMRNPFLGVHFTRGIDGTVYIGPTAIPAFGREHYGGVKGLDREMPEILYRDLVLFFRNPAFRKVSLAEPAKYIHRLFFEEVRALVKTLDETDIVSSDKAGIRPQLVDWEKKELVMDFVVLRHGNSIHILNAVSPGFTSSMAFAEYVVKKYITEM